MIKINNKKAVAPLFIFGIVFAVIIVIYLLLYLPIPAFTKLRTIVNYFLILLFFVGLQGLIIYGYYTLGRFAFKGFQRYKLFASRIADKTKAIYNV